MLVKRDASHGRARADGEEAVGSGIRIVQYPWCNYREGSGRVSGREGTMPGERIEPERIASGLGAVSTENILEAPRYRAGKYERLQRGESRVLQLPVLGDKRQGKHTCERGKRLRPAKLIGYREVRVNRTSIAGLYSSEERVIQIGRREEDGGAGHCNGRRVYADFRD